MGRLTDAGTALQVLAERRVIDEDRNLFLLMNSDGEVARFRNDHVIGSATLPRELDHDPRNMRLA